MSGSRADGQPVRWRDGVHIANTGIWCDARRARDVCFVSAAHAVPASRHGQLIATAPTLALLTPTRGPAPSQLAVPLGRPFTLGTVRLELLASGHGPGTAALAADVDGRRVVYAGAVDPAGDGLGGAAEVRACDALVVGATYGHPRYAFGDRDQARAAVIAFVRDALAAGHTAALLVTSPSKGLEVAVRLSDAGIGVCAHPAIARAARLLRSHLPELPPVPRWTASRLASCALLWPANRRDALDRVGQADRADRSDRVAATRRVALVSGRAQDPDAAQTWRADAAFAWSDQADFEGLRGYVDATAARRVYVTGRHADELARALSRPGRVATALGPPRQIPLFERRTAP